MFRSVSSRNDPCLPVGREFLAGFICDGMDITSQLHL
jgi:hypothetical protein